jgi:hypothetical protein
MITVESSHFSKNKIVSIAWAVTEFCQKHCHYCTAHNYLKSLKTEGVELFFPKEQLELDDKIVDMMIQTVKSGEINMFGGEPTLHPKGIEYFNRLCKETPNDVKILLTTHGDIDDDKILAIDPGNKINYGVSISYHFYQVKFDEWFEKVKLFDQNIENTLVSAIIPNSETVWPKFIENMQRIIDAGIRCELKSCYDRCNNPDSNALRVFNDMINETNKLTRQNKTYGIIIKEGDRKITIPNIKQMALQIPLVPNKTICTTGQFNIAQGYLTRACLIGNKLPVNKDTTLKDFQNYINNVTYTCPQQICTDSTNITTDLKIFGATLDDPKYKYFLENCYHDTTQQ